MDLIYMDTDRKDVNVLHEYEMDLAFGKDENDFECKVDAVQHCCQDGFILYFEHTEYGGLISKICTDTEKGEVTYCGDTWHGILESKILEPDVGQDYLILSGEGNEILAALIQRMNLQELFTASTDNSGIVIKNYQMNRYITGYTGIQKMLKSFGAKLKLRFEGGMVILEAVPLTDYTKDEEFDSDNVPLKITKNYKPVNHLVCLGKGELKERTVIHLFSDKDGNISRTQSLFGIQERTATFDYPSVESEEELIIKGIEHLEEYQNTNEIKINFISDEESYDIGDIVGGTDEVTGLEVATDITKKIVTVRNGVTKISYKVGE